ncbi:MAG: hypothetical protein AB1899_10390 [Pseudomonadota bacterium]
MERRAFLFSTTALLLAGCASQGSTSAPDTSGMKFSDKERQAILAFYGTQKRGTPPAQRAKPGDVLDAGQRPAKLPSDLLAKLPDLPAPYTRYVLGADIILVNRDSHAILDVIPQIAY